VTPEQRLEQSMVKLRDSLHEMELAFIDLATELQTLSAFLIAWEASYLAAYRAADAPYGDNAAGMMRWVGERTAAVAESCDTGLATSAQVRQACWQRGQ
jgi:hypothetical protein